MNLSCNAVEAVWHVTATRLYETFVCFIFECFEQIGHVLQFVTGVHFKKWCVMQSKIRAGAINEVCAMLCCGFNCYFWYIIPHNASTIECSIIIVVAQCSTRKRSSWCWKLPVQTSSRRRVIWAVRMTKPHHPL